MLIKNKSLSLLAKIAFCIVSFYGIILLCHWLMWGVMTLGAKYYSPTSYFFVGTGHVLFFEIISPLISLPEGSIISYIFYYIFSILSDFWYTMSVTIYCSLYAMLAQKLFFGDAFKKEYYKPKNFFNIYTKLVVILYLLIPFTDDMIFYIWRNYPNIKSFLLFIWQKKGVQTGEIYAMLTVFLVYKAIGLARKKSQAAPLQTTDHLRQPEMQA